MTRNVFPVKFHCSDTYGRADCPALAKMVWMRIRDPGFTWYGVDMEVLSAESIMLHVYEIADNFSGGIGQRIYSTLVTEFTPREVEELDKVVLSIYTSAAVEELERRERRQREMAIINLRKEMFGI
jgi:hypothetical protein